MIRSPMKRGTVRVGAASARRRRQGGVLALGRDSATRAELTIEREAVKQRARATAQASWLCDEALCEIGMALGAPCTSLEADPPYTILGGTDFAHVVARSQGGPDTRYNALWLCRTHHRMMEAPYAKGRLLVHRVSVNGVRGFDWQLVKASSKAAFYRGDYTTLAAGFIAAEPQ